MKKIAVTKDNVNILKKTKFINLNQVLLIELINILENIKFDNLEHDKSIIEFENNSSKDFIYVNLDSKFSIPIEITIWENNIDLMVCGNRQSIFEMYEMDEKEIKFLKMWFIYDITNEIKFSNNKIISNKFFNTKKHQDILFFDKCFFSFLAKGKKKIISYKSWVR